MNYLRMDHDISTNEQQTELKKHTTLLKNKQKACKSLGNLGCPGSKHFQVSSFMHLTEKKRDALV